MASRCAGDGRIDSIERCQDRCRQLSSGGPGRERFRGRAGSNSTFFCLDTQSKQKNSEFARRSSGMIGKVRVNGGSSIT